MPGLNSHFVSRFLTEPWEHGDRRLWYYDFDRNEVRQSSSRSLFAAEGTNTPDVEARLNQVIETPVAQAITRLVGVAAQEEQGLEWPLFRAVSLLLSLQPFRAVPTPERAQRLEEFVMLTDAELDELAGAVNASYQLGRITVRGDAPLLYPASGFFPLPAKAKDDTYKAAIALPVGGRHVFVACPRTIDWRSEAAHWTANGSGFVANMSVGTSSKVVIPPFAMADPKPVSGKMHALRDQAVELITLCAEHNEALERLNAAFGS